MMGYLGGARFLSSTVETPFLHPYDPYQGFPPTLNDKCTHFPSVQL